MPCWRVLSRVVADAWPLWLAIAGILAALGLGSVLSVDLKGTIQGAGTLLEAFGFGTVAIGLRETRRSFGRPSIGAQARQWIERIRSAFSAPRTVSLQGTGVGYSSASGELRLVKAAAPGSSLVQRVAALEENLSRFRDECDAEVVRIRSEIAVVNASVDREAQARAAENRKLAATIEKFAVGGLSLESVGLAWLFVGLVLASSPGWIAAFLHHLF